MLARPSYWPIAALALLAVAAGAAVVLSASSDDELQTLTPALQTPGGDMTIHNINDAFFLAQLWYFGAGPPYDTHQLEEVQYVETTFGEARAVLPVVDMSAPAGARRQEADDKRVWVIVAYGPFHASGIHVQSPEPFTTFWMVWPNGATSPHSSLSNERYDLGALGTVHDVELPLPPFPTPTNFRS